MSWRVSLGPCKDCGELFPLTRTARVLDVARGLSEPERCPDCRRINAAAIRSRGAAYWQAPVETDDSKRCWGKYGLAKLVRDHPVRELVPDLSVPVDLPLRPPATIADPVDRAIAEKFATIAPVAEDLVRNLVDPNGKRISIVIGPTGTGKSTWVPYRILRSKVGDESRICVTQPRLITLRPGETSSDDSTTPGFIARHLLRVPGGVGAGHEIGYQYSGEYAQQDRYTKLLYVTDGTLVKWLESGRIGQFGVVFVDEAHEQNANMERIFALLKYQMPRYPRLRVVVASATADVDKFRNYFGDGDPNAVFLAEPAETRVGTPYQIHDRWLEEWARLVPTLPQFNGLADPAKRVRILPDAVVATVRAICAQRGFPKLGDPNGDILVFLPTISIVEKTRDVVQRMIHGEGLAAEVFVSHGQMNGMELNSVKSSEKLAEKAAADRRPTSPQRIILATNYAETSVTFANLRYVIDSGLILEPDWDPKTCSNRYEPSWHSQAGCTQRKGRVGRVQDGECLRLYTSDEHKALKAHTPPEVTRQPLDSFLLSAKAAGIEDLSSFEWLGKRTGDEAAQAHHENEFARSRKAIMLRGTMDEDGDVTRRGLELGGIQAPRVEVAECLSEADTFACSLEMATFLGFISQRKGLFQNNERGLLGYARWKADCSDDLEFYLRVYEHWTQARSSLDARELRTWADAEGLNLEALKSVAKSRTDNLKQFARRGHDEEKARELDLKRLHRVRLVLTKCLQEWVYVKQGMEGSSYVPFNNACPCGDPVEIDRESACNQASDLHAFVCVERVSTRTGRLTACHVVRVNPAWLEPLADLKPIGMALLLARTSGRDEASIAERTTKAVTSKPLKIDSSRYTVGQLVNRLKVIRFQARDGEERGKILLAEDQDTGVPVVVRPDGRVDAGALLRGHVVAVASGDGRVEISQEQLRQGYIGNPGKVLTGIATGLLVDDTNGEAYAIWVELEPGISGRLHKRDCETRLLGYFSQSGLGQKIEVCLRDVHGGRDINLVTRAVSLGRQTDIKNGDVFDAGVVRRFHEDKDGRRFGVEVELIPGQSGFLHWRDVAARNDFASWEIGQAFPVVVGGRNDKEQLQVIETNVYVARKRHDPVRRGEFYTGILSGFYSPEGKRIAADVELFPGRIGRLPASRLGKFSSDHLSRMRLHEELSVEVVSVLGEKIELKPRRPPIKMGDRFQGRISGFLPGNCGHARAGVFVELHPGVDGFIHHSEISTLRLGQLHDGEVVAVVVSKLEIHKDGRISLRPV